jgi:(E)-4-hydroxy-3-methylbut-2-enyl-diphosphate synthase
MKTSSPILTIEAYKQLVLKMQKLRWDYPLHLGVTEAGEGQDGIIRSSIGMGVLLLSGIGDTIRMSLTNDPIEEILPAKILVEHAQNTYETAIMQNNLPNNNPLILALKKEAIIPTLEKMLKKHIPLPYALLIDDAVVLDKRFSSLKVFSRHDKNLLFTDDGLTHADIQKYSMSFIKPNNKTILECVATLPLASNIALELDYGNNTEERVIKMASDLGFLFSSNYPFSIVAKNYDDYLIVLDVLQNLNLLNYRAEIISCPGCGRTLYDIQSVVKRIKAKMGHLNGVKIAIMGCIVNGIGEMADADFGYVGSKKGKIDLYVKKTCVERDIDFAQAEDKLMALIKAHGKWYEADS